MKLLSLTLPGQKEPLPTPENLKPGISSDLGSLLSGLLDIVFYLAVFLAFYWLVWGAFQYMLASGKKEELAKARLRITWAIIGLIVTLLAYFIARFGAEIFPPTRGVLPF